MENRSARKIGLCGIAFLLAITSTHGASYLFAQQPQKGPPCGHYLTPPCAAAPGSVNIPPGATADQIFDLGSRAYAQRQFAVAAAYMEKAAAMGHVRAEAALGMDYANGDGEPKDLTKALYWLTLAAGQGHRVAQAKLGDMYEEGEGVPVNFTKAFYYHKLGAEQGWWRAEFRLGLEYELGYGTPRSRAEALRWLDLATNDGRDGASQQLAAMLRRSDTPARFKDMDALLAHFTYLKGQAYRAAFPKIPAGKNCREHFLGSGVSSPQSTYWCD